MAGDARSYGFRHQFLEVDVDLPAYRDLESRMAKSLALQQEGAAAARGTCVSGWDAGYNGGDLRSSRIHDPSGHFRLFFSLSLLFADSRWLLGGDGGSPVSTPFTTMAWLQRRGVMCSDDRTFIIQKAACSAASMEKPMAAFFACCVNEVTAASLRRQSGG
nr:hypothetical protein Iba_chr01bCG6320 [Ipomoea batatas]